MKAKPGECWASSAVDCFAYLTADWLHMWSMELLRKKYREVLSMLWKIQANKGQSLVEQPECVSSVLWSTKIDPL